MTKRVRELVELISYNFWKGEAVLRSMATIQDVRQHIVRKAQRDNARGQI